MLRANYAHVLAVLVEDLNLALSTLVALDVAGFGGAVGTHCGGEGFGAVVVHVGHGHGVAADDIDGLATEELGEPGGALTGQLRDDCGVVGVDALEEDGGTHNLKGGLLVRVLKAVEAAGVLLAQVSEALEGFKAIKAVGLLGDGVLDEETGVQGLAETEVERENRSEERRVGKEWR